MKTITPREIEILQLLSLGLTAEEMACKLLLSHYTVRDHRRNVIKKLKCPNGPAAVRRGIELGILAVEPI